MINQMNKSKYWLYGIAALLILAVALAAFYFLRASQEFTQAMAAYDSSDWLTAYQHFEQLSSFYKFSSSSNVAQAQTLKEECSLLIYAEGKYKEGDYAAALNAYDTYLHLYPESVKRSQVIASTAETYAEWGKALTQTKDYVAAIEKFNILLANFSDQSAAQGIEMVLADTHLKYGNLLRANKQSLLAAEQLVRALQLLRKTITSSNNQAEVNQARQLIIPTYDSLGQQLLHDQYFAAALMAYTEANGFAQDAASKATIEAGYQAVLKSAIAAYDTRGRQLIATNLFPEALDVYADAQLYAEDDASQVILEAGHQAVLDGVLARGQQLIGKNSFLDAMAAYENVRGLSQDAAFKANVEAGYQAALAGLITDTGKDGQKVIADALDAFCNGDTNTSPIIGASKSESAKGEVCSSNWNYSLPDKWKATTPGNFRYVVKFEPLEPIVIQSCPYTGGYTIIRTKQSLEVGVYNIITGSVIQQTTLYGSAPEYCPYSYRFITDSVYFGGGDVTDEAITGWLKTVFR